MTERDTPILPCILIDLRRPKFLVIWLSHQDCKSWSIAILLYLSGRNEKGATAEQWKLKVLCEDKGICLAPQSKIMWEEQLVDPPIEYNCPTIIFCTLLQK